METLRYRLVLPLAAVFCLMMAACQKSVTTEDTPKAVVSIKDIMLYMVDPSADLMWESVSYTSTQQGVIERIPKTEKDWAAVRAAAVTLAEAPNLLVMQGRAVAPEGEDIQDADTGKGINAVVVRQNLDRDWPQFVADARVLQKVALEAVAAADARDAQALEEIGGRLDEACEACHLRVWYPPEPVKK